MWQRRLTPPRSVACPCPILPWRLSDMRQGGLSKLPLRRMMAAFRAPGRPAMHDIVIRGGTVIDGSGKPSFTGDVAIAGGRIVGVGGKQGPARRDIDADGLLVTPGGGEGHTHYYGKALGDPPLAPPRWAGAT